MKRFILQFILLFSSAVFLGIVSQSVAAKPALPLLVINAPADGAAVSGTVLVRGTCQGLRSGRVSVAIDNSASHPAKGRDNWKFRIDTTQLANGVHTITAREKLGVEESIVVTVMNNTDMAVSISSPDDGADIWSTLTVTGLSHGAQSVGLAVDDGPFQTVNGVTEWNAIIEPSALTPGSHTLTARAVDGSGQERFDHVTIIVKKQESGTESITYFSSVDGEALTALLYLPQKSFNTQGAPLPLVVYLHGGGGRGSISSVMKEEMDARGWAYIAPDGRRWGLAELGCSWSTSAAYVDSHDPNVGPGEQDILDAIDWAVANLSVDTDRIYLTGFSMGGRGTYIIGLKNPDRFAAIGPMSPAIDMYEIFTRRPEPTACKEGMTGGQPQDSISVDTMYTITSGRFLIENAYNLPVFHGHGYQDTTANQNPSHAPFLHASHILFDSSWDGCFGDTDLCFGHTPTLEELNMRHPEGYDWAYMLTPVRHQVDSKWQKGVSVSPEIFGVEDPQNPGNLIGMLDFFASRRLNHNPHNVVYKSYTDTHRQAYWTEIDIADPWSNIPGAIRATRVPEDNLLQVELARVETAIFDLPQAQLRIEPGVPLIVVVNILKEPVFDPALDSTGEVLQSTIILRADFSAVRHLTVLLDGNPLPLSDNLVELDAKQIAIGPLSIKDRARLEIKVP